MAELKCIYFFILFGLMSFCSCDTNSDNLQDISARKQNQIGELLKTQTTFIITKGMTYSQINGILDAMSAGDTVEVEAGTYEITGKLHLRDSIFIKKQSTITPIFDAQTTSPNQMLEQYLASNNSDIDIYGIQFRNIRLKFVGANRTRIRYCIFDYGIRKAGTDKGDTGDAYIQLNNCTDMQVRGCVFKRRIGNSGRGIYSVGNSNTNISNNTFGDGGDTGYFVTSINDNSTGTTITGNTIARNGSWNNIDETDHGIYAHSFNELTITNNTISGWPADQSGGSIKARNGQNLIISDNNLDTSGILLYVYSNNPSNPFLKNVIVEGNTINVSSASDDLYHGIGYWRNTSDPAFSEYSIRIANNTLPNGHIKVGTPVNAIDFNSSNGGVFNNDVANMTLPSGINNSGNY